MRSQRCKDEGQLRVCEKDILLFCQLKCFCKVGDKLFFVLGGGSGNDTLQKLHFCRRHGQKDRVLFPLIITHDDSSFP